MIDEHQEESAAGYALDLLDPAERTEFEAALSRDPELRQRVRGLREAAAVLACTAPPADPPAALKARVLASIERPDAKRSDQARSRILPFPALIPWGIAACLALCAAGTVRLYLASRSENAMLRDQQTLAALEMHSVRNQLEAERIVNQRELSDARRDLAATSHRLADLNRQIADIYRPQQASGSLANYKIADLVSTAGSEPQTLAVAVWCPSMQEGILAVTNLPRLPTGKDYQLWIIDPHYAAPVSGGVFAVDRTTGEAYVTFKTSQPIKSIAKFAVSLERKGGAATPQGPIVLLSDTPRLPSS